MRRLAAALCLICALCLAAPLPTLAAKAVTQDDILAEAPAALADFAADPLGVLRRALVVPIVDGLRGELNAYADLAAFLLLAGAVTLCMPKASSAPVLELVAAAGVFVLAASPLAALTAEFCERSAGWQSFLAGFVPVFAAAAAAGGQATSAVLYSGFFLTAVNALAGVTNVWLEPCLRCFLAVDAAGVFSGSDEAAAVCGALGTLLQKAVKLLAGAFTLILGLQRVFGAAADTAAVRAGKALGSAVPVIGQALTGAAESVLAAAAVLRAGLGFACIAVIGVEFIPLYLRILLHLALLEGCALLAKLFGLGRCAQLLHGMADGAGIVGALAALFFTMTVVSTALMLLVGNGG